MTHEEHTHEHDVHDEHHHHGSMRSWMTGFVMGGLAGLAASLLMAPQSGRETRELVRYKATQLRQAAEQTAQETKERVAQISDEAKTQVDTLRQKGMEYVDEQKSRVNRVANAVTEAAKQSWDEEPNGSRTQPATSAYTPTSATNSPYTPTSNTNY